MSLRNKSSQLALGGLLGLINPNLFTSPSSWSHLFPAPRPPRRQFFLAGEQNRVRVTRAGSEVFVSALKPSGAYRLVASRRWPEDRAAVLTLITGLCGALDAGALDEVSRS